MEETESERQQETGNIETKKKPQVALATGLVLILMLLVGGLVAAGFVIAGWLNATVLTSSTEDEGVEQENIVDADDDEEESEGAELVYIGKAELGYVATNGAWTMKRESETVIEYVNGLYVLELGVKPSVVELSEAANGTTDTETETKLMREMGALEYATAQFVELGEDKNATELKNTEIILANEYKGYLVTAYRADENIWSKTWWFETDEEQVRYVTIEGPSAKSNKFNLTETFTLEIGESE